MWGLFFIGVAFCASMLFLPGFLQLRAIGLRAAAALACAPIVSLFELNILGIALGLLGISAAWYGLIGPVALLSVLAVLVPVFKEHRNAKSADLALPALPMRTLILYIMVAVVVTGYYFLFTLDGPESYAQLFDNAFHMNLIHAFTEAQRYSLLQATAFPTIPIAAMGDISFYPAAWHVVAALCSSALGISAAMAENIANTTFVAFVFPLSMALFLGKVFEGKRGLIALGSVATLAFVAFPWGFLVAGPLYSNLASFAVLPAVMALYMACLESKSRAGAMKAAALMMVGVCVLAFLQPNAVFTAAVVLTPYTALMLYRVVEPRKGRRAALAAGAAFIGFVAAVFLVARFAPYISNVVAQNYVPYAPKYQGLVDFIDLGGRNAVAQEALAVLVLLGIVYSLSIKRYRWLIPALAFFGVAYWSAASFGNGILGTYFSGFWYNDVDRIAACAVFVMVPLACLGFYAAAKAAASLATVAWSRCDGRYAAGACIAALCVAIYTPSFILAGHGYVDTAFGGRAAQLSSLAESRKCLTEDEAAFLEACEAITAEDGGLVANVPFDGSAFAYESSGINALYRHFFKESTPDQLLIREGIDRIGSDPAVRQAADNLGIKYVLLLDAGDTEAATLYREFLDKDDWKGFFNITDSTEGLEPVLSEGDMRLYRIGD